MVIRKGQGRLIKLGVSTIGADKRISHSKNLKDNQPCFLIYTNYIKRKKISE